MSSPSESAGDPVIDTTPTLPNPPAEFVASAAKEIPIILANVHPRDDGAIDLVASQLAERLQDAGHTLAAAQWAVHEAVQAGRLRTGLVEIYMPSIWNGPVGPAGLALAAMAGPSHWSGGGSGGGRVTMEIPNGKPAPFNCFKVVPTESLWTWWKTTATKKGRGRRGRKPDPEFDPKADKRLCEAWKAAKREGATREAFARERGISVNDLINAIDREKYRRRRDAE